jgi:hypothetical protein|nr:MAG TPA: Protein of unknown function (DUF2597) [Caudoviricetes sp.]
MGANSFEQYTKTYSTFSGCDIVATFNGKVIGELQAITYSISREKAPVYTMGSAEPRSFSRGKRGIAGTLVFTVFNRDALIEEFKGKLNGETTGVQKFKAERNSESDVNFLSVEQWDAEMSNYAGVGDQTGASIGNVSDLTSKYQPIYADEILPFDITITFANEYGQRAVLVVYGVELLNEGSGYSIDSVTTEKAYTFVARKIDYMKSLDGDNDAGFSSTY